MTTPDEQATGKLTLFVNGASERSADAIIDARALCDVRLRGRYRLSIVDVNKDPVAVLACGICATPTLIANSASPVRRVIGTLSDTDRVLAALGLSGATAEPSASEGPTGAPNAD
jgi:circadian clock protein KaiB